LLYCFIAKLFLLFYKNACENNRYFQLLVMIVLIKKLINEFAVVKFS